MIGDRVRAQLHLLHTRISARLAPPETSLIRNARMVEMHSDVLPVWMHPVEWSQLVALLEAQRPKRVLEWGCGGSTRAILQRSPFIERYVSIEHDAQWSSRVQRCLEDPRLSFYQVPPNIPEPALSRDHPDFARVYGAWCERAERDPLVMQDYVGLPESLGSRFDFILVDGRARSRCLQAGWDLLEAGGVIVLHDAQRVEYHDALAELGRVVFLEPWDQGQIAFARKAGSS